MRVLGYEVVKEANRSPWCCSQNSINHQHRNPDHVLLILCQALMAPQIQSLMVVETDWISEEDLDSN